MLISFLINIFREELDLKSVHKAAEFVHAQEVQAKLLAELEERKKMSAEDFSNLGGRFDVLTQAVRKLKLETKNSKKEEMEGKSKFSEESKTKMERCIEEYLVEEDKIEFLKSQVESSREAEELDQMLRNVSREEEEMGKCYSFGCRKLFPHN